MLFQLKFNQVILRFYLMMLVGIIAVYTSQSWLIFVTFAIAVSAILGYRIQWPGQKDAGRIVEMRGAGPQERRKAG